jgi:putative nucleotidyltransferase with HDIG domain
MGQVSKARLTRLADFEHPLLQQLANEAPGTWAHSTNMANMAEMAAKQIGGDGLLVRVGAYYHDIGKSPYSGYFVENQRGDNPHDKMDPESSAGVIRAHVTDGMELAREHGLPRAIVAFIFTHHGRDRLEYFWHKAQSSENPQTIDADFRYTGIPPQTKEQGILALCDAVEAASHTLKSPDTEQIDQLVRQIVFSKLRSGAFDDSGLSVQELRLITCSLIDSLRSSLHSRVKYPWQERGDEARPPTGSGEGERLEQRGNVIPLTKKRPQR